MPFDQFVIEQIAGDLLPNPTIDQLIATGFHRNTPSNYEGGIDFEQYRVEAVADRVATTGAVFLGLTSAARVPRSQVRSDLAARVLSALRRSSTTWTRSTSEAERKYFNKPFLEIGTDAEKAAFAAVGEWKSTRLKLRFAKREDMVVAGRRRCRPGTEGPLRKKLTRAPEGAHRSWSRDA